MICVGDYVYRYLMTYILYDMCPLTVFLSLQWHTFYVCVQVQNTTPSSQATAEVPPPPVEPAITVQSPVEACDLEKWVMKMA